MSWGSRRKERPKSSPDKWGYFKDFEKIFFELFYKNKHKMHLANCSAI